VLFAATPRSLQLTQSSATARFARTPTERAAGASKPTSSLRTMSRNPETEQAIASALQQSAARRGRHDSYHYSDDDSDACSVQSYGSVGYGGDCENMSEVLRKCASQDWSERKEGLINLQVALKADTPLTRSEIKRATEIFTRMFSDPHVKVLSLFLEVLAEFVELYRDALQDWAGLLLTKLIQKTGAENLLNSGLTKVNKCLDIVRDVFPVDQQFSILMRFISDQTQTKSLKVKLSVLKYLLSIITDLQPMEFCNTAETRQAVQIILSWSQDKTADIRKLSYAVLTSLFDLNTSEFNALQGILPKNYQDLCNKILLEYVNNYQSNDPSTVLSNIGNNPMSPPSSLNLSNSLGRRDRKSSASSARSIVSPKSPKSKDEVLTSLKKTTAEIAKYTFDTAGEGYDSGIPSMPNSNLDLNAPDVPDAKARQAMTPSQPAYNPNHYQADDDDEEFLRNEEEIMEEDEKLVESLLQELSHHNTRVEQRKNALISLTKLIKEGNQVVWEEHFRTCLLMLFETMGDREHVIRTLALRVLREFLKHQQHRFQPFAEITILKTLEAHKDPSKEVVRAAEELTLSVLQAIPHKHCLQVLCPVISAGEFPVNQTAIKMVTKIVEDSTAEVVAQHLDAVCSSLIVAYQHQESSVRKDSVYGLVAVHQKVAPNALDEYTRTLSPGKLKLLKLYIMRASENKS
jgi:CLIP-associating protein 1/2